MNKFNLISRDIKRLIQKYLSLSEEDVFCYKKNCLDELKSKIIWIHFDLQRTTKVYGYERYVVSNTWGLRW